MDGPPAAAARKPCCVCAEPGGQHCTKCKSRHYCSKACQLVDWYERGHKAQCRQMAEFQDRMLDALMPAKLKIKEEPAIVEDVLPADGSDAAARLLAARAMAVVKVIAVNDCKQYGTCPICLDSLTMEIAAQKFYPCCCTIVCTECSDKCDEYDKRCPLCRAPLAKTDAEQLRRLQKHADEGHAEAQLQLGELYRTGGMGLKKSLKRAVQLYELAAAQGHAEAQNALGCRYEAGEGVKIDYKTAALWYRRAAEQGFLQPQYNLGNLSYHGRGVAQSYDEAVRWWRLVAAQGDAVALHSLGVCHENGHGVPQDLDEALRLYKRAAAKGHAGAAAVVEALEARTRATVGARPAWRPPPHDDDDDDDDVPLSASLSSSSLSSSSSSSSLSSRVASPHK